MVKEGRRKYIKYLVGAASTIGVFIAAAYLKLTTWPSERKESVSEKPLTTERKNGLKQRVPPGQYEVQDLQVLHVGQIPNFDPENWDFQVLGLIKKPMVLKWEEFLALQKTELDLDFHCVTGWSKLDNGWGGVKFKTIYEIVEPEDNAAYATIICDGGYTTSLPCEKLLDDDVLFAYELDGENLDPRYGGPLRLVVPKKYAYKSAKWVRKIKFTEKQELGYWEKRGFSNTADPWTEDRYS